MEAMQNRELLGIPTDEPAPSTHRLRACGWVGVTEDGEHVAYCGHPAHGAVIDQFGVTHYACFEHLSETKAKFGSGTLRLVVSPVAPRPYREAIS